MTTTWAPIEDADQLDDMRLRRLLAHWTEAARSGRTPPREFVDRATLGDIMDWTFLYRVEREPLRFLYILCGEKIARRIGVSLTGKYVHDHPDPVAREGIAGALTAVVTTGRPHRAVSRRRLLDRDMTTEAVIVPLAGAGGIIDHVLALQILDPGSDA